MKLRTTTNSIRIRVRKSDIQVLIAEGAVYEQVDFPNGGMLRFGLMLAEADRLNASMEDGTIVVTLPQAAAQQWMNSEQVGMETEMPLDTGQSLHILIEKDFPCKDREEDLANTFFELDDSNC